jgi:hypothetical protein
MFLKSLLSPIDRRLLKKIKTGLVFLRGPTWRVGAFSRSCLLSLSMAWRRLGVSHITRKYVIRSCLTNPNPKILQYTSSRRSKTVSALEKKKNEANPTSFVSCLVNAPSSVLCYSILQELLQLLQARLVVGLPRRPIKSLFLRRCSRDSLMQCRVLFPFGLQKLCTLSQAENGLFPATHSTVKEP